MRTDKIRRYQDGPPLIVLDDDPTGAQLVSGVEGEFGSLEGDEASAVAVAATGATDPREAVGFVDAAGAAKVNVNAELRQRSLATTAEQLHLVRAGAELLALRQAQLEAVSEVAADKLAICRGAHA